MTGEAARGYHRASPFTSHSMKTLLSCAVAAASIASGCATTESNTEPRADREVREYTTGSNIPKRTPASEVKVYDREELERARDRMPQAPRPGLGGTSP